jgi:glycine/D-amino acid oxidase-like deaminating enzyme
MATLQELVQSQGIQCDLDVAGCWQIGRHNIQPASPIRWDDHGTLAVVYDIPGGAFDPRRYLGGLAGLIERDGGQIFEHAPVTDLYLEPYGKVCLSVAGKAVTATHALFATNPWCLPLLGLQQQAEGIHTVAVATEPLDDAVFEAIGWGARRPFYTLDLPYLWGRATADNCAVIGAGTTGLGHVDTAQVSAPDAVALHESLAYRIRHLHPALRDVRITHRWMGPLCRTHDSKPIITSLDEAQRVLIATGYRGHGVALSARVGKLLAEVIAGYGTLPAWSGRPQAS